MRVIIRKLSEAFKSNNSSTLWSFVFVEFILVIIGVLIALQLDNWNQNLKQKKKETAYMEDIRQSLTNDLDRIEIITNFNHSKDSCISAGIDLLGKEMDNSVRASEFLELLYTIGYFEIFRPEYVAFDNLVSTESIDLIKSHSLRNNLTNYYSNKDKYELGTQERVKDKTRQFLDYLMPLFISNEIATKLHGEGDLEFKYGNSKENEFHKNPRVFYELIMMKQNMSDQNEELRKYESQIKDLLRLIGER